MATNLEMMRKRFEYQGGIKQEDRMIIDKYRTFLKTLSFSYQGADIQLVQRHCECLPIEKDKQSVGPIVRALINPDKVKQDYDDKILSIDYKHNIGPGDIIRWVGTNSYWIINLEQLTEDAYFRGEIRRCRHKINFIDNEGNKVSTWAAIRGPVETEIDSLQKNQIREHRANLSLNILMPRNEKTVAAFERYKKFLFDGRCWEVQAPNSISTKNILEIAAEESYIDLATDDVERGIKDGKIEIKEDPSADSFIIGSSFIKPYIEYEYSVDESYGSGTWSFEENDLPIEIINQTGNFIELKWQGTSRNKFNLNWTNNNNSSTRVIVVDTVF